MKDYIEVKTEAFIQGNEAERMLVRKDEIKQVAENKLPNGKTITEVVVAYAAGNTWTKITALDSYDEIKAKLIVPDYEVAHIIVAMTLGELKDMLAENGGNIFYEEDKEFFDDFRKRLLRRLGLEDRKE